MRLVHLTLPEYLHAQLNNLRNLHSVIAGVYLPYLNIDSVKHHAPSPCITPLILPFAQYVSCYWGFHSTNKLTKCVKYLAWALLVQYPPHVFASIFLLTGDYWERQIECSSHGFTGIHGTASLSIHELVNSLIERGAIGICSKVSMRHTLLTLAARHGGETVVGLLVSSEESRIKPADRRNHTGMLNGAWSTNIRSPKMTINPNIANSNSVVRYSLSPLSCAAEKCHEQVVRLLLTWKDINPNSVDVLHTTPLFPASKNGDIGIVKLVHCQKGDMLYVWTYFLWATQHRHQGVVKPKIGPTDVKPDSAYQQEEYLSFMGCGE